jgi:DNA-binding response OmpR family regulator
VIRILLVEDDAMIRRFVRMALEVLPVELVEAATLAAAQRALQAGDFALVLTDLMLPDGHGTELLGDLQALPPEAAPMRVVFSAGVSAAMREQLQALGVARILEKPVPLAALLDCAEQALARAPAPASEAAALPPGEPAGAADPDAPVIERHFGGDARLFHAFKASALAQFAHDVEAGEQALRAGDVAAMRRTAHNLKSVLRLLGEDEGAGHALALEVAASGAASMDALAPLWQTVRSRVRALP